MNKHKKKILSAVGFVFLDIIIVIASLWAGATFFTYHTDDCIYKIDSIDTVVNTFYEKIVAPEGYVTSQTCSEWMSGYGYIDGPSNWKCFFTNVDPIESTCDSLSCEKFTFTCACYKNN